MIWVEEDGAVSVDKVVHAPVPAEPGQLRDMVLRYQMHRCQDRCKGKPKAPSKKKAKAAPEDSTTAAGATAAEDDAEFDHVLDQLSETECAMLFNELEADDDTRTEEQLPTEKKIGGGKGPGCKYGFPFKIRKKSGLDQVGMRFEHIRLTPEDAHVVSYNPTLLLAWEGHCNVTVVTDVALAKYLVKYLCKAEPSLSGLLEEWTDEDLYHTLRVVSALEAILYLLSYHVMQGTKEVMFINTDADDKAWRKILPKQQLAQKIDEDPNSEDIFCRNLRDHYASRPDELANLTIGDFVEKYKVCTFQLIPKYALRANDFFPLQVGNLYVYKRNKEIVARWRYLTPADGEPYYFQVLVLKVPFRDTASFISSNNKSATFKEEAHLRELVNVENEDADALNEAEARQFDSRQIAKIAHRLALRHAKKDSAAALPLNLDDFPADADLHRFLDFSREELEEKVRAASEATSGMTPSQKTVFDFVFPRAHQEMQSLCVVTGPAGTGKSFLIKRIVAALEVKCLQEEVILGTSGSAASQIGGVTIHSFLKFDLSLKSSLIFGTTQWGEVAHTDTVIVDEISMMDRTLFEAMDRLLREVVGPKHHSSLPFGGRTVLLFGDLYQLPAVNSSAKTPSQVYDSLLWAGFCSFSLTENCRQADDPQFAAVLGRIRVGAQNDSDLSFLQTRVCGQGHPWTEDCHHSDVIICATNQQRSKLNATALDKLTGQKVLLNAIDEHRPVSDTAHTSLKRKGRSAPEVLSLKIGARVVVTRNLNVQQGVVNGALGMVTNITKNKVMVTLDTGHLEGISRVKEVIPRGDTVVHRLQFPLDLAWAVTVHRVQGITVEKSIAHVDSTMFEVGQAYMALSRVKSSAGLHLHSFD